MNYTKLIREARERARLETCPDCGGTCEVDAGQETLSCEFCQGTGKVFIEPYLPVLCDAVEAQAKEIERLRNGFKAVICNLQGDHTDVALDNCCRALEEKP